MKSKLVTPGAERTFVLVFASGDEPVTGLTAFAAEQKLSSSHLTGIGAFQDAVVGFFDWETKDYRRIAHVRPTLEVVLVEAPETLRREYDPSTRLALINLDGRGSKP